MKIHGIRLFSSGLLILLSTAVSGAQDKAIGAADVTPPAASPVAAPVAPPRPAELPPRPPKVTCRGDQLTISADNSTLEAILFAVKGCTGAKIEIPAGTSMVRSFEELGPGPVREVLDELLSGTQYNYVIQSSDANPLKVETVLMSMRTGDGPQTAPSVDLPMTGARQKWQHMQKFDKPDPNSAEDQAAMAEASAAMESVASGSAPVVDANAAQPATAEPAPVDAHAAPAATPSAASMVPPVADPSSNTDPAQATSDRINAMQQMFQQRQKMIEKQNQGSAPNN